MKPLVFFALLTLSLPVLAAPYVEYIYDGDTVNIVDGNQQYKLRISDIDAPEKTQAYGLKSRRALIQLCTNASATVFLTGIDQYHRQLGKLQCNGQDVSQFMVRNGYAWFYSHYSNDGTLAAAQQEAQNAGRGLWKTRNPMPPWEWRKRHKH